MGGSVAAEGLCGERVSTQMVVLEFDDGRTARIARPRQFTEITAAVASFGLRGHRPVLVVAGGAAGLDEDGEKRLAPLFSDALLPVALARQAAVVDGGTDSGVMRLLGRARAAAGADFPLVGVAAEGTVILPGDEAGPAGRSPLESNHSHFVLVPGSSWGDESPWLSKVAAELAGGAPSATVLISGGQIALEDVTHSLAAGRPVLAIAGTGRAADRIAAAAYGDHADKQVAELANSPLVSAVSWVEGPVAVRAALRQLLAGGSSAFPPPSSS